MRKQLTLVLASAVLTAWSLPSFAATGNVPFAGLITATCVLTVGTPGVLSPNPDFSILSSSNGSGQPGTISALSTGTAFRLSAIAPSAFTLSPPTGGDNVTFTSSYSASGATNIGTTPGNTATLLNNGLTNVNVNLVAQKSAGTYAAGAYATEVVVRCE